MKEEMIQQIVEEVLKQMNESAGNSDSCSKNPWNMLVIGDAKNVPEYITKDFQAYTIEDYIQNKDIYRYGKVVITALSLTDLSDIALGRDASPASCAVVNALLAGIDVCMTENAPLHRKYSGSSNHRLYQNIENNLKMLETYGVKTLKDGDIRHEIPAKPAKFQPVPIQVPKGSACVNSEKLITENIAKTIAERSDGSVCIAKDSIVTPAAWDIFRAKGITVERQ